MDDLERAINQRITVLEQELAGSLEDGLDPDCYNIGWLEGAVHELRKCSAAAAATALPPDLQALVADLDGVTGDAREPRQVHIYRRVRERIEEPLVMRALAAVLALPEFGWHLREEAAGSIQGDQWGELADRNALSVVASAFASFVADAATTRPNE